MIVTARDNAFAPGTVTVSVGETVTWNNAGTNAHEVYSTAFGSGPITAGGSWSWRPTKAGTYTYVCRYHESLGMRGTLVVRASGLPKTGGDHVAVGLLVLGAAAVAGLSLRYGWRLR